MGLLETMQEDIEAAQEDASSAGLVAAEATKAVEELKKAAPPPKIEVPTPSSLNILDLGCKINDSGFKDNAKLINAALHRAYSRGYNTEFYFPGGLLCTYDTIEFPKRTGIAVRGNAIQYTSINENAYWSPTPIPDTFNNVGGPVSRIGYLGPAEKPAVFLRGSGTRIDGLTIQDGLYVAENQNKPPIRPGSVGIAVEGNNGLPTSKTYFPSLALFGWDTGIKCLGTPEHQTDSLIYGVLFIMNCKTAYRVESWQSVDHVIQYLHTAANETIFDFEHGGGLVVNYHQFMPTWGRWPSTLLLRLGAQKFNPNTCWFNIENLKVDGGFPDFKLLRVENRLWGKVRIHGLMCESKTKPAEDAVTFLVPCPDLNVDIDVIQAGRSYNGRKYPATTLRNRWMDPTPEEVIAKLEARIKALEDKK